MDSDYHFAIAFKPFHWEHWESERQRLTHRLHADLAKAILHSKVNALQSSSHCRAQLLCAVLLPRMQFADVLLRLHRAWLQMVRNVANK